MVEDIAAPDAPPAPVISAPPDWDHSALPSWFAERQRRAWDEFQSLPAPRRNDEAWRFADLKNLAFDDFVAGEPFSGARATAAVTRSQGLTQVAAKIVLGNDAVVHREVPASGTGLVVLPLSDALRTHADLVARHFMNRPTNLGGEKFQALHLAALRGGVFVYVPPGVEVGAPVEIHQWLGGINASVFPHSLIVADRGAKVTVLDYFQSLSSEPGFSCGVTDLTAGEGASIDYICCQRWSRKVRALHFSSTTTGRDAAVKSAFIHLGARWARTESHCLAEGEGSRSEMLSLTVAEGQQEIDCRTRQIHRRPHTFSNLLYKNVLFDAARTIFAGLIFVEPGAHFTDAYQTCRSLLLSDEAEASSLPGLEINADQVKCSHGSTSGPLRDEEIYYLRSRGVREETARHLLAFGFCREIIDRIGHPEIEAAIIAMVDEKFRRMGSSIRE